MSGRYSIGEVKVRPGVYFRETNGGGIELTAARNGVVAVAFRSNWGPLGEVVTLTSPAEIADIYGDDSAQGSNVDILNKIFLGGAREIKAVRAGSDGAQASVTLKGKVLESEEDAIRLVARYPGSRALTVSVQMSLENELLKELTIYDGTRVVEKVTWVKSDNDVVGLEYALRNSAYVKTSVVNKLCSVSEVQQRALEGGASPTVVAADFDKAFAALEATQFNVLCVDTNETAVHALVASFMKRANDSGIMAMAVVGEPTSVELETRMKNAAAFNSPNMVYVLNGFKIGDEEYAGFNAAAVVAGLIAYLPSSDSVTHKTIPGASEIVGPLTNTQIISCLQSGAIVFTVSATGSVWIEQGINTLTVLSADQDAGWKKIRRTKCRYELIQRILENTEGIIGNVGNDSNGRQTFIAIANGVINQMIAENKLVSGTVTEDPSNPAKGDSAWFIISVVDLDSIEKVYITYRFAFSEA